MSQHRKHQSGFAIIELVIILVVLAVIGVVGWKTLSSHQSSKTQPVSTSQTQTATPSSPNSENVGVGWANDGTKWTATGAPPACPDPLSFPTPVDISKATAVLYPGQTRGGNYKPHGGFIFTPHTNDSVTISAPLDAKVYKGVRYIESGEVQYMFIFINPCGIMYRFDHLLTLSPAFQKIADTLPQPKENDSQTTVFNPVPSVKASDNVATAVGFKNSGNTSVDFGVYDLRQKNAVSQTAAWQQAHPMENEFGAYAICWLDNLSGNAQAAAKALPGGDGKAGKQSDYCK